MSKYHNNDRDISLCHHLNLEQANSLREFGENAMLCHISVQDQ